MPKQFLKLFQDKSLFQLTLERNQKFCSKQLLISNAEQYFLALDQTEALNSQKIEYLLEPMGRNTASAIALACWSLDKDELVLVTPSDHLIKDEDGYKKVLEQATILAHEKNLVTFGVVPTYAETGFGYIEYGENFELISFHEKPNEERAKAYVESKNYLWNSGMFMFEVGVFLEELKKYAPSLYELSSKAYANASKTEGLTRIKHEDMLALPSVSVDYAVMEKSEQIKVVPSEIGWSDLGSFDSLSTEIEGDEVISVDAFSNWVLSKKQVALVEVDDLIVVNTPDALLISKKGSTQKVKEMVEQLKEKSLELFHENSLVYRPWGTYEVLLATASYKIKRIVVQPNKSLSLQKHYHRNEHWIVVSGTATVRVGDESKLIRPNESTYIKMGELHQLSNEGKIPVVLIEAQVGEYVGEDDIVRLN
jgi:mannose-1-phosphate guanylyltransferase